LLLILYIYILCYIFSFTSSHSWSY
jgi:hypothetical protein